MKKLSDYVGYNPLSMATEPMPTIRRLPEIYDMTLQLPAIPTINVQIKGYDAATLDALAFESGVLPELLIARWIREKAYARQLESEVGR
jgi:hypothetical protein